MRRTWKFLLLAAALWLASATAYATPDVIYVDKNASGTVHDGMSWQTAFTSVQAGINSATSGKQVWVADGVYAEAVNLKDGVALYGGFAGNETALSQRDWDENVCALDATGLGSVVVSSANNASALNRIDGFTIRDGLPVIQLDSWGEPMNSTGGGIRCINSTLTVMNNVITGNAATEGGGIFASGSTLVVTNNEISGNSGQDIWSEQPGQVGWGAGLSLCDSGSALIANNIIANNACYDGSALIGMGHYTSAVPVITVTNNTIVGNVTSGMFTMNVYTGSITNNVVAFNEGVGVAVGGASVTNNDSFGNDFNYSSRNRVVHDVLPTPSTNLSIDPLFVDRLAGDYHLQSGSALVDAGSDAAVGSNWTDVDRQQRVLGAHVDIGADEL